MCILIVDDSEDIRLLLESILRPAGYGNLLFAESANEAYEILGLGKVAKGSDKMKYYYLIKKVYTRLLPN